MVPVFKYVGDWSTAKNYCPVSLLSVFSKVFEKLRNNGIVDHLEKCGLFSDFQYGCRSSRSTADLLAVVSYRIARACNRTGATRAVALNIWFGVLVFFTNLSLMEFQVRYLALFLLFFSNRRLRVVLDGKASQEYTVNVPQGSILGPTLFLSMLLILLSTLNVICGNN